MPDGSVLLVEIERQTLTRVGPTARKPSSPRPAAAPTARPSAPTAPATSATTAASFGSRAQRVCARTCRAADYKGGSIQRVELDDRDVSTLYTRGPNHKLNGPNDLVFDAHGGFYFTDLGKVRERDWDRGCVYYAKADGSQIKEIAFPLTSPNGCGLSPDGKTLYVAETQTGRVWAFDITAPGEIAKQAWPSPNGGRLLAGVGGYNLFDSMAVDGAGNVCVATLFNPGITVISPDGASVRHIALPGDPYVTNICFGGPGLQTAYVTLSMTGKLVAFEWDGPGAKLNYLNT